MVVDIGAGTTDIAVMSLKGISHSTSVRIGGEDMDEAIIRYMRNQHNLVIGPLTAEQVKKKIGLAAVSQDPPRMKVRGRNAATGLPAIREIDGNEVARRHSRDDGGDPPGGARRCWSPPRLSWRGMCSPPASS